VLGHEFGSRLGQSHEAVVLANEVGFAVDFHQGTLGAVDITRHHAFGSDARCGLAGLGAELDAQQFFRLGHVAIGFCQCLLAFHHGSVGLATQFGNHACGNCSHCVIPSVFSSVSSDSG
jgi:hypothetical protein